MAIDCKHCGKEIDAHTSARCGHCHQLICADCIAPSREGDQEVLCIPCAQQEQHKALQTELQKTPPPEPPRPATPPMEIPLRSWIAFGLLLFAVFVAIAFYPFVQVKYNAYYLYSANSRESQTAARTLAGINNRLALDTLIKAIWQNEHREARRAAIEVLGECPDHRALETLLELTRSSDLSETDRMLAEESLIRHQRLFPSLVPGDKEE